MNRTDEIQAVADTDCVDSDGDVRPEHDYGEFECVRCGAEAGV